VEADATADSFRRGVHPTGAAWKIADEQVVADEQVEV
jgi:hypothetical protein